MSIDFSSHQSNKGHQAQPRRRVAAGSCPHKGHNSIWRGLFALSLALWLLAAPPAWPQTTEEEATDTTTQANEATPSKPRKLSRTLPRHAVPSSEEKSMTLLSKSVDKDAILWLNTASERFFTIWQKDRSGVPKGALLIIHAEGEHPLWPHTTKPLHDTLPDYGWSTLAISLPPPDHHPIPKRTQPAKAPVMSTRPPTEDQAENQANATQPKTDKQTANDTSSPQNAETITVQRLEAAIRFLHDRGQFNLILLGNGVGAIRAHDFIKKITPKITNPKLKEKLEKPIRTLILVNARNHLPNTEAGYEAWFMDPTIPVLDIFERNDPRNREDAKKRQAMAKQKKASVYKQVQLNALNQEYSWGENRLSRRIRSFLDNNAVGVEIKNARLKR